MYHEFESVVPRAFTMQPTHGQEWFPCLLSRQLSRMLAADLPGNVD